MTSMEDSDLRARLQLAQERIKALELELAEAIDMREVVRRALKPRPNRNPRMELDALWPRLNRRPKAGP